MDSQVNIPPVSPAQPQAQNVPSSADWSRLRPLIKDLYHDRQWSMAQVRDHLQSLGYHVNTRMVRTRISQWDLQKNHRIEVMAAALRLLDPDPALWPSPQPRFLIRGRRVTMEEVLRFFRRRGIHDPVEWCRLAAVDRDRNEPAVSLLREGDGWGDSRSGGSSDGGSTHTPPSSTSSSSSSRTLSLPVASRPPTPVPVSPPILILTLEQRAVANMRDYCAAYLGLGLASMHQEPTVHHFTTHGRFGDRMQDGLAQMKRKGPGAFPSFDHASNLVQPLLSNCHPMAMAQFLAIVCELVVYSEARSVLAALLRHSAAMASTLRVSSPLIQLLRSLSESAVELLQRTAIASLRAALDVFSQQASRTWHGLYIQERLCDCLYHGRDCAEGSARRARLLREQEEFYGPFKNNVLWTTTNVADDQLNQGDLDGAEAYYSIALARAELQDGFARAKTRYAALEGLGRVERRRFERVCGVGGEQAKTDSCRVHLQKAYRHVSEALYDAQIWFDPASRRIARVTEQLEDIRNLLQGLHIDVDPPSPD